MKVHFRKLLRNSNSAFFDGSQRLQFQAAQCHGRFDTCIKAIGVDNSAAVFVGLHQIQNDPFSLPFFGFVSLFPGINLRVQQGSSAAVG